MDYIVWEKFHFKGGGRPTARWQNYFSLLFYKFPYQWPMLYLVYLKRASITIQVDPATAPSYVQLFLFSSRAGRRSWRRRWSWRWFCIVTFWCSRCSAISASNTGVHQPESHFSILSSRTFVVTKEVATCIDLTSLLTLASLLHQIQLVLVAVITFFAAVKHLQCRILISVSFG